MPPVEDCFTRGVGALPVQGRAFRGLHGDQKSEAASEQGLRKEIYHYRDEHGLEVDFIVPVKNGGIGLLECKAARTVVPPWPRACSGCAIP